MFSVKQRRSNDFQHLVHRTCNICSSKSDHFYEGYRSYFSLIGISFFPLSKLIYKSCTNCGALKRKKYDEFQEEIPMHLKDSFFPKSREWSYFLGFYLIAFIVLTIFYLIN